jgi:peptidoglycan/xylan/chitin deacetylase (PgdA/CDA1 family)
MNRTSVRAIVGVVGIGGGYGTPVTDGVVVHPIAVPSALGPGDRVLLGGIRPLVGPFDPPPFRIEGPADVLASAAAGLPEGEAHAEAIAVRLRRRSVPLRWGEPHELAPRAFLAWSERRGRASVALLRADPSLLPELQLGGFHHAGAAGRAARRVLMRAPRIHAAGRVLRALADAAFWRGVRDACDDAEWARLTRGYAALLYHRLAGEMKPGQERLDLPPEQFAAQLRMLRRLGFRPLSLADAIAFHAGARDLPRRAVLVTADDAFADCAAALTAHGGWRPALFVPTAAVGGAARWAGGEPIAGWPALRALREAGGELGAHSRTHADLTRLDDGDLGAEVGGAVRDLAAAVPDVPPTFAYPHGRHDVRVREAAQRSGALLAFTSAPGRNGAGTDPWCLRRVGVKAYDSLPAVAWKALTGEPLPGRWERRRRRRTPPRARP